MTVTGRDEDPAFTRMLLGYIADNHVSADKALPLRTVDPVPLSQMNTILAGLDPHSTFYPAPEWNAWKSRCSTEIHGVGTRIVTDSETKLPLVYGIKEGSPAEKVGIIPGDIIQSIDGKPTSSIPEGEWGKYISGEKGTTVTLSILREGEENPVTISVARQEMAPAPVKFSKIGDVGYIGLQNFSHEIRNDQSEIVTDGAALVRDAIKTLEDQEVSAYILDLRGNPGGLTHQANQIAGYFLGADKQTAVQRGRKLSMMRFHETPRSPDLTNGKPLIVLVDEFSASVSEMVCGALQDYKRATIMGRQTFGKGSIQIIFHLNNGTGLHLTIGQYYTPNGHSVQSRGIVPDTVYAGKTILDRGIVVKEADMKNALPAEKENDDAHRTKAKCGPILESVPEGAMLDDLTSTFGRAAVGHGGKKIDWMLVCAVETLQGNPPKWTITLPVRNPS